MGKTKKTGESSLLTPVLHTIKLSIIIIVVGIFILVFFLLILSTNNQTTIVPEQSNFIECYVNGRKIQATREDCQSLSIQSPQPAQQSQPAPQTQQRIPVTQDPRFRVPPVKTPTQTKCDVNSLGQFVCTTY